MNRNELRVLLTKAPIRHRANVSSVAKAVIGAMVRLLQCHFVECKLKFYQIVQTTEINHPMIQSQSLSSQKALKGQRSHAVLLRPGAARVARRRSPSSALLTITSDCQHHSRSRSWLAHCASAVCIRLWGFPLYSDEFSSVELRVCKLV